MATGLPTQTQVVELLRGPFAREGFDIEQVVVDTRTRPARITVVADADSGLDLDSIAALSRCASRLLDEFDGEPGAAQDRYVLEVTSPGVERPLIEEKHFRRARGRKVELTLSDGAVLTGRLGLTRAGVFALVVRAGRDWQTRELPITDVRSAVVQVEFTAPAQRELELAGGDAAGPEGGA